MKMRLLSLFACAFAWTAIGCMPPMPVGTIDNLDETADDTDGDGFLELDACGGSARDGNIAIRVANTITRDQAATLLGQDIPDFIGINIAITIDRIYAGGETCTDTANEELGPFELAIEATCPDRVDATVEVLASIFGGTQSVFAQTFTASSVGGRADAFFECDKLIEVIAELDERTGQPTADIDVRDQ